MQIDDSIPNGFEVHDSVNIFEAALLTMQAIHDYARVRCRQAIVRKFDARLQVDKGQGAADGAQDVV